MNAIEPIAEEVNRLDRIFGRADVVSQIGAGPDPRVVPFDRLQHVGDFVVAGAGTVIVNRDANVVLRHELIEAVERIFSRVSRDIPIAEPLGQLKHAAVRRMVLGEWIDALRRNPEAHIGHFTLDRVNLFDRRFG